MNDTLTDLELTAILLAETAAFAKVQERWDNSDPVKVRRYVELHREFREKVESELCSD